MPTASNTIAIIMKVTDNVLRFIMEPSLKKIPYIKYKYSRWWKAFQFLFFMIR
ncbi:hypothetical protein BRYFOR_05064 [Marvinbryantia formatexigens DSM 14469]|uniref:Uncharacterized protein n=1 Tax=Marvinbryantia formatexigens DSM 14469 TaxID=478749 RepID=C6L8X5_9FIRM|nr:hypothetical protein BRYFOR_05064 [Marvinbryantia formatexigens DSM 14469]